MERFKTMMQGFWPRGLATIVFFVIVSEEQLSSGLILQEVVVCTICLSILLHGVTANAWARGLSRRLEET